MPTYQYRCTDCGEPLEVVQSFSDPALTTCPSCNGTLRKVFSAVGVVFKGSGFYKTDSRSSGRSSGGSKDGAAAKADSTTKADSSTKATDSSSSASSDASSSNGSTSTTKAGSGATSSAA